MIRKLILGVSLSTAIVLAGASAAFADSTVATGQPSQSCQAQPPGSTPGNSVSAPGSVFNPNGVSGTVYAGNTGSASLAHANSANAISQYDVACFQQASH
jgi:hypothetical protein